MKKKNNFITVLLVLMLLAGLGLIFYPSIADYLNSSRNSTVIADYRQSVTGISGGAYEQLSEDARQYNEELAKLENPYSLPEKMSERYNELLNTKGSGEMGYIEIPSINVSLPIYHGTSEDVLQTGIGHLEWSSLPVGGESTHCVLSGHRGLPSAKLFTNLDSLQEGDLFTLHVLNEGLTYEVDQILTVLPEETEALQIEEGKDYCTLVTCTPYGINTHRLLVRGHRVNTADSSGEVRVTSDAFRIEPPEVAAALAFFPTIALVISLISKLKRRNLKR